MTYRDDHDAAIARAAALEDELERVRGERDELEAKVARLDRAAAAARPPGERPAAADQDAQLADDLAQVVESGYRARWLKLVGLTTVTLVAFAILVAVSHAGAGQMIAVYGIAIAAVITMAVVGMVARSPSQGAAVIEAIRTNPERVTRIVELHRQPGLMIYAGGASLRVYTYETTELIARLSRRCPDAKLH